MQQTLPDYPAVSPPEWCVRFVGIPYAMGGRDATHGIDCWGLSWLVLGEQFGLTAPAEYGVTWGRHDVAARIAASERIMRAAETHFDPIEPGRERPGDIIVLRIGAHPLHCGVVVGPGWMLHAAEGADSALERFTGLVWRNRVAGFWRVRR